MALRLKLCGIRDNIDQAASCRPDYMGFIFYKRSPRFVENPDLSGLDDSIKKIGVFVNEEKQKVIKIIRKFQLDFAQLHGDESPEYCRFLQSDGIGVIKVFRIDDDFNFDLLDPFNEVADFYLFDTKSDYYGGSGKGFNWNILKNYDQKKPFFLSGGLDIEALIEISPLSSMNIHALDINSGVEISPGKKDIQKIRLFIKKLNQINYEVFGR